MRRAKTRRPLPRWRRTGPTRSRKARWTQVPSTCFDVSPCKPVGALHAIDSCRRRFTFDAENGGVHPDRRRLSRRGGRGRARCPGKGRDPPHRSGAGRPEHATARRPGPDPQAARAAQIQDHPDPDPDHRIEGPEKTGRSHGGCDGLAGQALRSPSPDRGDSESDPLKPDGSKPAQTQESTMEQTRQEVSGAGADWIRGGWASWGFADVAKLTHQMESLLDRWRRHEVQAVAQMVDVLLESADAARHLLARHQAGGQGQAVSTTALLRRIADLA